MGGPLDLKCGDELRRQGELQSPCGEEPLALSSIGCFINVMFAFYILQVNVLDIEKTLGTVVDAVLQVRLRGGEATLHYCLHYSYDSLFGTLPSLYSMLTLRILLLLQEPGLPAAQREERAHALKKLGKVFQASVVLCRVLLPVEHACRSLDRRLLWC